MKAHGVDFVCLCFEVHHFRTPPWLNFGQIQVSDQVCEFASADHGKAHHPLVGASGDARDKLGEAAGPAAATEQCHTHTKLGGDTKLSNARSVHCVRRCPRPGHHRASRCDAVCLLVHTRGTLRRLSRSAAQSGAMQSDGGGGLTGPSPSSAPFHSASRFIMILIGIENATVLRARRKAVQHCYVPPLLR